jgi:polysaccharide export outer membrane protein
MVYVVGEVTKPGGYLLSEHETMTVLQALSLAGGFGRAASPRHAKLLRLARDGSNRTEISFALDQILEGKAPDIPLSAGDIFFIPSSLPKKAALRALEAAIQTGSGIAIWH